VYEGGGKRGKKRIWVYAILKLLYKKKAKRRLR